jgi:hypothetical protein
VLDLERLVLLIIVLTRFQDKSKVQLTPNFVNRDKKEKEKGICTRTATNVG